MNWRIIFLVQFELKVNGMHCKSCEILIKDSLNYIDVEAEADHKTGIININFDEKIVSLDKIKKIVKECGYNTE